MATGDVLPTPVYAFCMSEKLQRKVELFRENIASKKDEIRSIGDQMRYAISSKEEEIIEELDDVLNTVNLRIQEKEHETQVLIESIERDRAEMESSYKSMAQRLKTTLPPLDLPEISAAIESLKIGIDVPLPCVNITWRLDELRESIDGMFSCEYEENPRESKLCSPGQIKLSKCEGGLGENQLNSPHGMAINPKNQNIYVTDWNEHKVQIYTKDGEFVRCLNHNLMKFPDNILFLADSIYIQCESRVLKFSEYYEKIEKDKMYGFTLCGICTDETHIFVGSYGTMNIIMLTSDLVKEKRITLGTEFCKSHDTKIRDVAQAENTFYVLLSNTEFPIQAFSKQGILLRCVIQRDCLKNACYLCVDQRLNLIVSDRGDKRVKIFSNEGNLLKELYREQRQFLGVSGVAVNKLGCAFAIVYPPPSFLSSPLDELS